MKKQTLLFGTLAATVVVMAVARRCNQAVPLTASQMGNALLHRSTKRLMRNIALRGLAGMGAVWVVGRACETLGRWAQTDRGHKGDSLRIKM